MTTTMNGLRELGVQLTSGEERGCGERKEGGLYACCGLSSSGRGRPLEHFILDPAIPWESGPFRGMETYEREDGVIDLIMWVGEEHYPSMASFLEEGRQHGFSKRIPGSGSEARYHQLTPGVSRLLLVHPCVIPQQPYLVASPVPTGCVPHVKRPHSSCGEIAVQWEGEGRPCTFATWDHAALIAKKGHEQSVQGYAPSNDVPVGTIDITVGSTTFTVALPLMPLKGNEVGFEPGIFVALPLTHFEYIGQEGKIPTNIADLLGDNLNRTVVVDR